MLLNRQKFKHADMRTARTVFTGKNRELTVIFTDTYGQDDMALHSFRHFPGNLAWPGIRGLSVMSKKGMNFFNRQ